MRWYRRAADLGHAPAQSSLGLLILTGEGAQPDDAGALRWYRAAAAQNDGWGLHYAGLLTLPGRGTAADRAEGVRLLQQAARAAEPEIRAEAERWLASLPIQR